MDRARLDRVRFPLGELTKPKVREIARDAGLTVADRPDSMEVCFLAGADYRERVGDDGPGPIRDLSGALLGRHNGLSRYTLGQRQGLGIAAPHPLYVLRLDRGGCSSSVIIRENSSFSGNHTHAKPGIS